MKSARAGSMRALLRDVIRSRTHTSAPVTVLDHRPLIGGFERVRVRLPTTTDVGQLRPADAFKLHLPPVAGADVPEPSYDDRGRLVWTGDPELRPVVRCFTAIDDDHDARVLTFDAYRHAEGVTTRWLDQVQPGDRVHLVGWRTEFVASPTTDRLLLIGDVSALPALVSILSGTDLPATVWVVAGPAQAALLDTAPETVDVAVQRFDHEDQLLARLALMSRPAAASQAWVAAESGLVRAVRTLLLRRHGVDPDALHAAGYWTRGQDWETMFDHSLVRFLRAADSGIDVSDPGVLQALAFG